MDCTNHFIAVIGFVLVGLGAVAQQPPPPPATASASANVSTVRGCLDGQRGNYIVVEDKTGLVYVLKGVSNKLDAQLHHEVEVKGRMRPGIIKKGMKSIKY